MATKKSVKKPVVVPDVAVSSSRIPKIFVTVTADFDAKFTGWAKRLGVSKSQFGNMCIQAGMNSLIRAVAPEEAFSPEMIVQIMSAAKKQNIQLDFNDFKAVDG